LAEQGTFITIARLLWGFRIEKARDAAGKEIPVDIFNYTYVTSTCCLAKLTIQQQWSQHATTTFPMQDYCEKR